MTFTLTPTPAGTLLRVEQSGFRLDQKQALGGAKAGWQDFLSKLERVLASINGNPISYSESIMHITLWIFQILLALHTAIGAVWKFFNPTQTVPSLSVIPHGVWLGMSVANSC